MRRTLQRQSQIERFPRGQLRWSSLRLCGGRARGPLRPERRCGSRTLCLPSSRGNTRPSLWRDARGPRADRQSRLVRARKAGSRPKQKLSSGASTVPPSPCCMRRTQPPPPPPHRRQGTSSGRRHGEL
eukprot:Amastigsp_a9786_6.p4 type:complete len:128 gc:universal Amastigsp_a9786_6:425-42(-)